MRVLATWGMAATVLLGSFGAAHAQGGVTAGGAAGTQAAVPTGQAMPAMTNPATSANGTPAGNVVNGGAVTGLPGTVDRVGSARPSVPGQQTPGSMFADRSNGAYIGRDPNSVRIGSRFNPRFQNRDTYPVGDPYGRTLQNPVSANGTAATRGFRALDGRARFDARTAGQATMFGGAIPNGPAPSDAAAQTSAPANNPLVPPLRSPDPRAANRDGYPSNDPYGRTLSTPIFDGFGSPTNPIRMDGGTTTFGSGSVR